MVRNLALVACLATLVCAIAHAQGAIDAQRCEDYEAYRHIKTTEPTRPNGPLRQENISDEEVREVQRAAWDAYPDSIVNISGLTEGCDCEEGTKCSAQLWLALDRDGKNRSLVLSRIEGHWKIGAVQQWWNAYEIHKKDFPGHGRAAKQVAWARDDQRLLDAFPTCPAIAADWMLVRSGHNSLTCIDTSHIEVSGYIRRANFKHVFPSEISRPRRVKDEFSITKYRIDWVAFDCRDHRTRIDDVSYYDSNGTVSHGAVEDPVLWHVIGRDSVLAEDMELMCGWKVQLK